MVNPMLLPLVIILGVALWFILSFTFKPLGRFLSWIWKRALVALGMRDDDEDDQKSEEDMEEK